MLTICQNQRATQIKSILLEHRSIDDVVVLEKKISTGELELFAYLVLKEKLSLPKLQSHLKNILNKPNLPEINFIPIAQIPLTPEGEIDQAAINNLEILDSELVRRWEEELTALPEIDRAAVIIEEKTNNLPAIHLSDLLPNWKTPQSQSIEPILPSPATTNQQVKESSSKPLAISEGQPLPHSNDLPLNLARVLQNAARIEDRSLTFLQNDGSKTVQSYQALLTEAERILCGLRQLSLKPQDKVILQLESNQDVIVAFWGCILGGFIPVIVEVPPTYSNANNGVNKLCNVWKLLDNPLIITSRSLQKSIQDLSQWLPKDNLKVTSIEDLKSNEADTSHHPSQPNDPAFFNLTSGSTGMPKCISLTHWNLIARAAGTNILCQHRPDDVILNWLPFDHIGSISDWHIRCVLLGCDLVYVAKEYILGRPLNWLDLIDKYRISHSWAPNFAYALVNDALKQEPGSTWDLSCVRSLLSAGEAVSSNAVQDFIDNLAVYKFKKTAIRPAFGMAEMGSGITYARPTEAEPSLMHTVDKASLQGTISLVDKNHPNCSTFADLGGVIPGVSIRIVDEQNNLLQEDTIGHLQVKGDAVFKGYYKNEEVNSQVFTTDGWFDTGDLGFIANGHLVVTGRAKETIIINGANYYNHEIETVVEELEGIKVSYTAACAVRETNSATEKLAIFFSTAYSEETTLIKLLEQIRHQVVAKIGVNPDYLIPVTQETIPKTAIGKIQRKQLSQSFEKGEFDRSLKQLDILLANENTIPNWFYQKIWRPYEDVSVNTSVRSGISLIFLDEVGLGEALYQQLGKQQPCVRVIKGENFAKLAADLYRIDPSNPKHYHQLLNHLKEREFPINQVVHLWTYQELEDFNSLQVLQRQLDLGIYSLLFLTQALAEVRDTENSIRLLVVANNVQNTRSIDRVNPGKAPILGAIKTIPQELPWLNCSHLDLSPDSLELNATRIFDELQVEQKSLEVAYRDGKRLIPRLEKIDWDRQPKRSIPFKTGGMYLLSGGLGGIGLEIAKYLLKNHQARLLLVGRTSLPDKSEWETYLQEHNTIADRIKAYQSLENLGGEISYQAVDICDLLSLETVVNRTQSMWNSQLDGVIHLAGNVRENSLVDLTHDEIQTILNPKVLGTWTLNRLVKDRPNCLFISFSSVNSFFGGNKVGAYSAANRYLEAFAHYQRHQCSLQSYCFAWSMWNGVGMNQNSKTQDLIRAKGYYPLSVKQGLSSLIAGLHYDREQMLIGLDNSQRKLDRYIETNSIQLQKLTGYFTTKVDSLSRDRLNELAVRDRLETSTTCSWRQLQEMPLTNTGEIDRQQLLTINCPTTKEKIAPKNRSEQKLVDIWQEVLEVDRVGITDNFFELGGSSLLGARLLNEIEKEFNKKLPMAALFEAPTVEQLAKIVSQENWQSNSDSIVPIQPKGHKPPLFFVNVLGEGLIYPRSLSHYLGPEQPMFGIRKGLASAQQADEINTEKGYPKNAEIRKALAAHYIREMQTLQPEGPYYLIGISAGGNLAYRMAQQLQEQGQEVAVLALLDSLVGRFTLTKPPLQVYLANNWQKLKIRFSNLLQLEPEKKLSYLLNLWTNFKDSWQEGIYQRALVKAIKKEKSENNQSSPGLGNYSGKVTLFKASLQPPGTKYSPDNNWGKIVTGELDIHVIPGDHLGMLNEPNIQVLAAELKECLDKAMKI
jgi:acyl-CoA synthetase (AMP-forming)/AMP-acid ligase II/thioesterase domain-containing protein/NAD(P)-dependent dehydrogenase (short-subunit alcohol dehydrogenase family)/acyl carrier protein